MLEATAAGISCGPWRARPGAWADGSVQTADGHGRASIHPWALGSSKPGKAGQAPKGGEGEKELM